MRHYIDNDATRLGLAVRTRTTCIVRLQLHWEDHYGYQFWHPYKQIVPEAIPDLLRGGVLIFLSLLSFIRVRA